MYYGIANGHSNVSSAGSGFDFASEVSFCTRKQYCIDEGIKEHETPSEKRKGVMCDGLVTRALVAKSDAQSCMPGISMAGES